MWKEPRVSMAQQGEPQLLKLGALEPVLCNKRSPCNEKAVQCNDE